MADSCPHSTLTSQPMALPIWHLHFMWEIRPDIALSKSVSTGRTELTKPILGTTAYPRLSTSRTSTMKCLSMKSRSQTTTLQVKPWSHPSPSTTTAITISLLTKAWLHTSPLITTTVRRRSLSQPIPGIMSLSRMAKPTSCSSNGPFRQILWAKPFTANAPSTRITPCMRKTETTIPLLSVQRFSPLRIHRHPTQDMKAQLPVRTRDTAHLQVPPKRRPGRCGYMRTTSLFWNPTAFRSRLPLLSLRRAQTVKPLYMPTVSGRFAPVTASRSVFLLL